MNILHYIMGIPPVREGGAIKYAIDLAENQASLEHKVFLLYPGAIRGKKNTYIKRRNIKNGVKYFEIINPLPTPGAFGMCNEKYFMEKTDPQIYYDFLMQNDINVIHFHSLQGLHLELLEAADELKIKKIFTSHDYFGICPKTDLINKGEVCTDVEWNKCAECCDHPASYMALVRRQSHWFRILVDSPLLPALELVWNKIAKRISTKKKENNLRPATTDYKELKNYYSAIFKRIDLMHYNSSVAKKKYEEFLGCHTFLLKGVIHKDITDKRKIKFCDNIIRLGYLGNEGIYKGFPMLIEVLDKIHAEGKYSFSLSVYFKSNIEREYIVQHRRYQYSDIDDVFNSMDVLLVPSLWAETYGFVVLEAIMHGVPVVITTNVGAKDFLKNYKEVGLIVKPDKNNLENALIDLLDDRDKINKMNENICNSNIGLNYEEYTQEIIEVYRNL